MKEHLKPLSLLVLALSHSTWGALSPGDLMFVGYTSNDDSLSFVTWVDLPPNETLLFIDGEYDGGGNGSGEGIGGGYYTSNRTISWENTSDDTLAPGTVVVISGLSNTSSFPNIGSTTGGFSLTNQGEQIFIAQGTIGDDNGNSYLDGDLIFGLDYEGSPSWGENNESKLPSALNTANGNISIGHITSQEYSDPRNILAFSNYPTEVSNNTNWSFPSGNILSPQSFENGTPPPTSLIDELGTVSGGLLFHPKRLNQAQPIIDEAWMIAQGATANEADNINGPSCIRLPDWLPTTDRAHPTAVYYLYFGNHSGDFIRMAWSANLTGPWTGWNMDASLPLQDRGVLSLGADGIITPGNDIELRNHIASPQVFVDNINQRFLMYYHGPASHGGDNKGQSTVVATSANGLNFNQPSEGGQAGHGTLPVILGESYFRVFEQAGRFYAFSNTGDLWAAPAGQDPLSPPNGYNYRLDYWDRGPNLFTSLRNARGWPVLRPRHFAVHQHNNVLYAILTYKEDRPERITVATFDFDELPTDYQNWSFAFPEQELMQAETGWEGGQFPPLASRSGNQDNGVNQLRDPGFFQDSDGRSYLFYSGQGEDALGLAQLVTHPQISGNTEVTTGQDETFTIATNTDVTPRTRRISQTQPIAVAFDAESNLAPLFYNGNGSYSVVQSNTASAGNQGYQLAHLTSGDDETLTFPARYYAKPEATIQFQSRLANSTVGQVAELQISFDGTLWQTIWMRLGGANEASFTLVNLDLDGLEGRAFNMRLRYIHDPLRNPSLATGATASDGWFIDDIIAEGFEEVILRDEQPFTPNNFSLQSLSPLLTPHLAIGDDLEDRFLIEVDGTHATESTGFGKPFVLRVRSSYEDFLDTYLTESQQDDPLLAAATANPDQDGLNNLLEHVFGTNPLQSDEPSVDLSNAASNELEPTFSFQWNPETGYQYFLQMGTTLQDFQDVSFLESSQSPIPGGNLRQLTIKPDLVPSSLPEAAFFRLRVSAE